MAEEIVTGEQQENNEPQYPYVVRGAKIYCTCGTHVRRLDMPKSHGSYVRDKAMLNKDDCKVGIDQNIPPFGACQSAENNEIEIKIEDTRDLFPFTDENGNPIEMPIPIEGRLCVPKLASEWMDAYEGTLVDGKPALRANCTITCAYGGTICFMDAGQDVY